MKTRSLAVALGLTLLAGCTTLPPFLQPSPQALVVNGDASLRLRAEVSSGRLGTQALVTPYTAASIHHVTLTAFKLDGSTEISLQNAHGQPLVAKIPQAHLDADVTLSKLWLNTTYRIKARAYADEAETRLISTGGTSDQIDVAVTTSDSPSVGRIKVTLMDTPFAGTASASITITPGKVNAGGVPAIALTLAGSMPGDAAVTDASNDRIRKIAH